MEQKTSKIDIKRDDSGTNAGIHVPDILELSTIVESRRFGLQLHKKISVDFGDSHIK